MNGSAREAISPIGFDSGPRWPVERHVMLRIEYVISQVAVSHAGQSEEVIASLIAGRLRGLGVTSIPRHVQEYARAIAQLPESPPASQAR